MNGVFLIRDTETGVHYIADTKSGMSVRLNRDGSVYTSDKSIKDIDKATFNYDYIEECTLITDNETGVQYTSWSYKGVQPRIGADGKPYIK